jgi:hypothetical protein
MQEAVVADPQKARRQDVLQEPSEELVGLEHHLPPAVAAYLLVAERERAPVPGWWGG